MMIWIPCRGCCGNFGRVGCIIPEALDEVGAVGWLIFCKIPWKSMPPLMLTVAQTSVALPWALNHVEDFFRRAAHSIVSDEFISSEK